MTEFKGFTSSETFIRLPNSFFSKLLAEMDDLGELKIVLYALWRFEQMEAAQRILSRDDIASDTERMGGWPAAELDSALERAVRRGILLRVGDESGGLFALNSPRGRATAEALGQGRLTVAADSPNHPPRDVPNVFRLYEENIGPLTPLMADALRDAEGAYSAEWIAEAMEEALKRNIRNWKYIEAILKGWKERGRDERRNQKDVEKNSGGYGRGAFSEYLEGGPDAED